MKIEYVTLCYVEKDNKYLMLHRTKKENDINKDKYIGIGGHLEENETPLQCILREAKEESGLTLLDPKFRGNITFYIDDYIEVSWLYTCNSFVGELIECNEGDLVWVDKKEVLNLPIWEGDKIFFKLLEERKEPFKLKLVYKNDVLIEASEE